MTQQDEPRDTDESSDQPVTEDPVADERSTRAGGPDPLVARLVDLVLIVGLAALVLGGLYFKLVLGNSWGITIARTVVTVVVVSTLTGLVMSIRMARRRR